MAEFCLDCFNKMNGTSYAKRDVILEEDLCEGCGEVKPCVVGFRSPLPKILGFAALAAAIGYLVKTVFF